MEISNQKKNIRKALQASCSFILAASIISAPAASYAGVIAQSASSASTNVSTVVRAPRVTASGSSSSVSRSTSSADMETLSEKAVKLGLGQKVEKKQSNDQVEFTVHNMVIEKNQVYADLSFQLLKDLDYDRISPRISIDRKLEEVEYVPPKNKGILAMLRNMPQVSTSHSSGYSMNAEINDDHLYTVNFSADIRDLSSDSITFNLDQVDASKTLEHTYSFEQWYENPVEGIKVISIEHKGDELFVKAESKDNINFKLSHENAADHELYSNSAGTSYGDDGLQTITQHWKLDGKDINPETYQLTAISNKELDSIPCNFSIDVPVDMDKVIKPIYSKELNKTVSSILGDVTISNVEVTPLSIHVTYAKDSLRSDVPRIRINRLSTEPTPTPIPDDLASYKQQRAEQDKDHEMFRFEHDLVKVESASQQLWPRSSSTNIIEDNKEETTLIYEGSYDLKDISISILQEDKTYQKFSLED